MPPENMITVLLIARVSFEVCRRNKREKLGAEKTADRACSRSNRQLNAEAAGQAGG